MFKSVMSKLLWVALILATASFTSLGQKPGKLRKVTLKGTVVAEYRSAFPCGWHVCGLSLIVRVDRPEPTDAVVHVTYMDQWSAPQRGKPKELVQAAARWKFRATEDPIQPLQQYWNVTEDGKDVSAEVKTPAWSLLRGAANEDLPFGAPLKNYSVAVGKFWKID